MVGTATTFKFTDVAFQYDCTMLPPGSPDCTTGGTMEDLCAFPGCLPIPIGPTWTSGFGCHSASWLPACTMIPPIPMLTLTF